MQFSGVERDAKKWLDKWFETTGQETSPVFPSRFFGLMRQINRSKNENKNQNNLILYTQEPIEKGDSNKCPEQAAFVLSRQTTHL